MQLRAVFCIFDAFWAGFGAFCRVSGILRVAETAALTAGVWVGEFGVCIYDTRVASARLIFPGVVMQPGHEKQMPRRG